MTDAPTARVLTWNLERKAPTGHHRFVETTAATVPPPARAIEVSTIGIADILDLGLGWGSSTGLGVDPV